MIERQRCIMSEIRLDATIENIEVAVEFINEELKNINCPEDTIAVIGIAVDEILANIAMYAYKSGNGDVTIQFENIEESKSVMITFIDEGIKYNPLAKEDPDITLSLEDREIGGLGIFIVKNSMDDMIYEYVDNKNVLKIVKNI